MDANTSAPKTTKHQRYYAKNRDTLRAQKLENYYVRTYDTKGLPRPVKGVKTKSHKSIEESSESTLEMMKMMAYIIWLHQQV